MSTNAELLEQPFVLDDETKKRLANLGKSMAEMMHAHQNIPSFMRMAVDHQREHPEKSPMQCMSAVREPYMKAHHEAIKQITDRICNPQDCK